MFATLSLVAYYLLDDFADLLQEFRENDTTRSLRQVESDQPCIVWRNSDRGVATIVTLAGKLTSALRSNCFDHRQE